ncbi:hypothetical protein HPP92_016118 [Vanilla planifolia]|uniref:Uncharacterized protein n=1 Tax=Vanilla planifolia TaxID=51239 RepID=A0A835QMH2_VANPL|nr:hypothetical protein HPP92_016118 [Vanilla planifolia]
MHATCYINVYQGKHDEDTLSKRDFGKLYEKHIFGLRGLQGGIKLMIWRSLFLHKLDPNARQISETRKSKFRGMKLIAFRKKTVSELLPRKSGCRRLEKAKSWFMWFL